MKGVNSYAHGCNCAGSMGRGIVVISLMTPILFLRIILTTLAVICMLMRFLYSSLILKSPKVPRNVLITFGKAIRKTGVNVMAIIRMIVKYDADTNVQLLLVVKSETSMQNYGEQPRRMM